jgi:iron(III) transport system substrate-binding protein
VVRRTRVALFVLAAVAGALVLLRGAGNGGRRVVLYTAHAQDALDLLVPRFERETGIRAEVIQAGSGEVVQRLRAERERPRCDVVFGIAGDQLEGVSDLLADCAPREADRLVPAFQVGTRWRPYTALLVVLLVNTQALAAPPAGWADLARPDLQGQVSSARADTSGSAYMQLRAVLAAFGERGWEVYGGLLRNTTFAASSSMVPQAVSAGEVAVGITLEDSALRYVKSGAPVKIVYPVEGTVAAPDGIALAAGAPHPGEAAVFIDWALSAPVQELLARELGRRSVRVDAAPVPGLPPLEQVKTLPYDFARAASEKQALLERWQRLVAELGR